MLRWLSSDWLITNLSGYVRDLVLIVFLVTCLEMLAPENAMKRFVQVVAGFMVIVAMLQPLLQLVSKGRDQLDQATWPTSALNGWNQSWAAPPGTDTETLKETNADRALRLVRDQVTRLIRAEVERARPGATTGVDVALTDRGEVRTVRVVVTESGKGRSSRATPGRIIVDTEPVRPVGGPADETGSGVAAGARREVGQDDALAGVLAGRLGLDADKVTVLVRTGQTR